MIAAALCLLLVVVGLLVAAVLLGSDIRRPVARSGADSSGMARGSLCRI